MKSFKTIAGTVLIGGCVALSLYLPGCTEKSIQEVTISILRQIPCTFLVMQTDEELALATINNGGWLFGPRIGQATAKRRTHWGIDLQTVKPADVEVTGKKVRVMLPDPKVLDTALDFSTLRVFSKRSGFQLIGDLARGRSIEHELLEIVYRTPPQFSTDEIQTRRIVFVGRLNRGVAELFRAKRLDVEFY